MKTSTVRFVGRTCCVDGGIGGLHRVVWMDVLCYNITLTQVGTVVCMVVVIRPGLGMYG